MINYHFHHCPEYACQMSKYHYRKSSITPPGWAHLFQAQLMGGLTEVRESGRGGGEVIINLEKTMVSALHKELDWRLCSQGSESSPNFSGAKRGYPFRRLSYAG